MLAIGVCLLAGWLLVAWILLGLLVTVLSALIFGRFRLGSDLYCLLHGKTGFANRTSPWVDRRWKATGSDRPEKI